MDFLDDVEHTSFKYIFISVDVNDSVREETFTGKEKDFKKHLVNHFNNKSLENRFRGRFKEDLKERGGQDLSEDQLDALVNASHTYQIIPLTLPSKSNGYEGINAYIDDIGRVKGLPNNARASRICSTDISGDCFISKTFDDEDKFLRVDFTIKDYENFVQNPPSAVGRWEGSQSLMKSLNCLSAEGVKESEATEKGIKSHRCAACNFMPSAIKPGQNQKCTEKKKLLQCGACRSTFYCSPTCQKNDWKYHKRICKPPST